MTEVCMSELQIFKCNKSLMSSQLLPDVRASVSNVQVNPLDFARASLVLLSVDSSAVVSTSSNQSSNCVASLPVKILISCNKVFAKFVSLWAGHRVSVYCLSTLSRGSDGADG